MTSPLETTLLLTDQQRSVLHTANAQAHKPMAYTAYGHRPAESGMTCLLGFNGELPDPVTGHYLLGNGYRAFNPVLMRFNSPDSLSPFGEGGLNGYAYCGGDPVNRVDPTGHFYFFPKGYNPIKGLGNRLGLRAATLASTMPIPSGSTALLPPLPTSQQLPLTATALGEFDKFQGMPHIHEKIIRALPGKDIASLAGTSSAMKKSVYSATESVSKLFVPMKVRSNFTAAAKGNIEGILPLDAINMLDDIQPNIRIYDTVMTQLVIRDTARRTQAFQDAYGRAIPRGRRAGMNIPR